MDDSGAGSDWEGGAYSYNYLVIKISKLLNIMHGHDYKELVSVTISYIVDH